MKRKKNREKRQQRAKNEKTKKARLLWERFESDPEVEPIIYLTCEETKRRYARLGSIMSELRELRQ